MRPLVSALQASESIVFLLNLQKMLTVAERLPSPSTDVRARVPLQDIPLLHPAILTPEQADVVYSTPEQVMTLLNKIFGTYLKFNLSASPLRDLLNSSVEKKIDFGTIYALIRSSWKSTTSSEEEVLQGVSFVEQHGQSDTRTRDEAVHGQTIVNPTKIKPRRLWDLYANRIIPYHYSYSRWHSFVSEGPDNYPFWAITHSWMHEMDKLEGRLDTSVNGFEWPVPIPADVTLEAVRAELLNLGAKYAWVDVLCLRQKSLCTAKEAEREEEWKVDLPTIGVVFYKHAHRVVQYMNGLGRALEPSGWDHNSRH